MSGDLGAVFETGFAIIGILTLVASIIKLGLNVFFKGQEITEKHIEQRFKTIEQNGRDTWEAIKELRISDANHITKEDLKEAVGKIEHALEGFAGELRTLARGSYRA